MKDNEQKAFLSFLQDGASLGDAARVYASLRLFVHPLKAHSKQPDSPHGWHDATTNAERISSWWAKEPTRNIGIGLRYSNVAVIDVDPRNGGTETLQSAIQRHGPLPPTYTVATANNGTHYYYRVSPDWYDDNENLPKVLGPGLELLTNHYVVAPPSILESNRLYRVAAGTLEEPFGTLPMRWLYGVVRDSQQIKSEQTQWDTRSENWVIEKGERNDTLSSIAGWARAKGSSVQEIIAILYAYRDRVVDFEEIEAEIPTIAASVARYTPADVRFDDLKLTIKPRSKEPELDRIALRGPIGRWIKFIEDQTESHPAALLAQALTVFGNIIGARHRGDTAPGFEVEDSYHRTALFTVIVGKSAKSGKGDSWSRVKKLMQCVDPTWLPRSGVQTGEGLIDALMDDQETGEKANVQGEEVSFKRKGNETDKRYFIIEPEFGRTLHAADRKGSTLKDVYRDLWDEGATGKVTAGSKQTVTGATVSLVSHITKPELERDINSVDLLSGFGNRFLWVYTQRTRTLSRAPSFTKAELAPFWEPLREALEFARGDLVPEDYEFTEAASMLWDQLVKRFNKPGKTVLIDALTARARPIVYRMAVIYAVAECSDIINIHHLRAAEALWDYTEQTVEYIFGSTVGDKMADKILASLFEHPSGLTRTNIYELLGNNPRKEQVTVAFEKLKERNLINIRKEKRGRKTVEIYMAKMQ